VVEIKGLEKFSSRDFPGHISSTIFFGGCKFRCPYCHNAQLVLRPETIPSMTAEWFLSYLDGRKGWLEAVCLTGGEPLLHEDLETVIRVVRRPSLHVEIETNGTVAVHPALDPLVEQFNVSPKLAHSGNDATLALVPERLEAWAAEPRAWFKFVVATPADLAEIVALQTRYGIAADHLFVMPEGTASSILRERSRWLAEEALERGWRFTDRLHIHLYGDTRGT